MKTRTEMQASTRRSSPKSVSVGSKSARDPEAKCAAKEAKTKKPLREEKRYEKDERKGERKSLESRRQNRDAAQREG